MGRSLQRDLNRIAEVADTSSPEGLSYILSGEALNHVIFGHLYAVVSI
jgi:uncharacterized membrane protein